MILDDFEGEVNRIEQRYHRHPRPDAGRSAAILTEEVLEAVHELLAIDRDPDFATWRRSNAYAELIQVAAYAYHLALRIKRREL